MRKLKLTAVLLMLTMALTAQVKMTNNARLRLAMRQAAAASAARATTSDVSAAEKQTVLVVKVAPEQAAETYTQMRQAGATVKSRIGDQAVVSLPLAKVEALTAIKGISRIDVGHKPKFKTDHARQATGVSRLNGPTATVPAPGYTGRGTTVCVIDVGFDFQHAAFRDAEGKSRIKAVYFMDREDGRKFTADDPVAGKIEFPGSVYDTPELIASLTTDTSDEMHGTHTAGIAAGSLSPLGFGGMAPEADIVLIPISDGDEEENMAEGTDYGIIETALSFAKEWARQTQQPMVISLSANTHDGPHNGTGTVPEAIAEVSKSVIPVLAAGNEGDYPIYMNQKFTANKPSIKTLLGLMPSEINEDEYELGETITGYARNSSSLWIQLSLINVNEMSGRMQEVWQSDTCTITADTEEKVMLFESSKDAALEKYLDGQMGIVGAAEDGQLVFSIMTQGALNGLNLVKLSIGGSEGTEIDMWSSLFGFNIFELRGYTKGNATKSGGDWTSTPDVISVGAYCVNDVERTYDGETTDEEDQEYEYVVNDIALFSSYGTMFNGVTQPVVCAPGTNIVSSWNSYSLFDFETVLDEMQWNGSPYGSESGTSMACPVVSGIIALWLQAQPELTLAEAKELIKQTADNDEFTAKKPEKWGYGKINAAKGIAAIKGESGISDATRHAADAEGPTFDLTGRRVKGLARGIYIKGGKKIAVN